MRGEGSNGEEGGSAGKMVGNHCNVVFLAIFSHYFYANYFFELGNCMSLTLALPRCTRFSAPSHLYALQLPNERANQNI